jgi:hypothetical protein
MRAQQHRGPQRARPDQTPEPMRRRVAAVWWRCGGGVWRCVAVWWGRVAVGCAASCALTLCASLGQCRVGWKVGGDKVGRSGEVGAVE